MSDPSFRFDAKVLFFIPSFYGAITWGAWLILYSMCLVRLDECSYTALVIYLFVQLIFLLALLHALPAYSECITRRCSEKLNLPQAYSPNDVNRLLLLLLYIVGFIGIAKYVIDISRAMGGFWWFMFALLNEAVQIRAQAEFSSSIGTQIGYAGWIAIGLTMHWIAGNNLSRWWLFPALLQFAGNLAYLDRTRPLMILLTALFVMLPSAVSRINVRKIVTWVSTSMVVTVLTFWGMAEWVGKTYYKWADESGALPGITYDIYTYGVSGFAYFNKMLEINVPISYLPERVLYPLLKFTSKFELNQEPPSQILDFFYIPFSTNIGTFLEPFYSDGGLAFMLFGILFFSFGLNAVGLFFLKANTSLADYAWANLCLALTLSFILNKMVSFPLWLFCGIGLFSAMAANQNSYFKGIKMFTYKSKF